MFSRIFSAALLLLAGCSKSAPDPVAQAEPANRVECALGAAALAKDCAIEVSGNTVTVRHADGSFRRFEVDANGDFGTADGAEDVSGNAMGNGAVDAHVGDAHYRFAPGQLP